jgi:hypothetical protein
MMTTAMSHPQTRTKREARAAVKGSRPAATLNIGHNRWPVLDARIIQGVLRLQSRYHDGWVPVTATDTITCNPGTTTECTFPVRDAE